MKLRPSKRQQKFIEISQYVDDLKEVTKLRDKALEQTHTDELIRYDETIKVMQEVLIFLNTKLQ